MTVSPVNPISKAWDRMVLVLFKPFQFAKWLCIGLGAFLWSCGENGGSNYNFSNYTNAFTNNQSSNPFLPPHAPVPPPSTPPGPVPGMTPNPFSPPTSAPTPPALPNFSSVAQGFQNQMQTHLFLILFVAFFALLVFIAFIALVMWLKARGNFMFIHQLAHNSDEVALPWSRYADLAWSLFRCLFIFTVVSTLGIMGIMAAGVGLAWPDIVAMKFRSGAILALVICIPLILIWSLVFAFIRFVIDDLIAPAMYARMMTVGEVWPELLNQIIRPHLGNVLLFCLLTWGLSFAAAMVIGFATCCTCCCAALPYIGTVIVLPVFAFRRLYGMYFLDQFGGEWAVFPTGVDRTCPRCNYNLRGLAGAQRCPECGAVLNPEPPAAPPPPPPSLFPPVQ